MELRVFLQHADMFDFEKEREAELESQIIAALEEAERLVDEALAELISKRNNDLRFAMLHFLTVVFRGSSEIGIHESELEAILDDTLSMLASKYEKLIYRPTIIEGGSGDYPDVPEFLEYPYNLETWDL